MSLTLDQLKTTLDALPESDRLELARHLRKNLPDDSDDGEGAEDEIRAARHDELRRRMEDIHSGKEVGIPFDEALARARELCK